MQRAALHYPKLVEYQDDVTRRPLMEQLPRTESVMPAKFCWACITGLLSENPQKALQVPPQLRLKVVLAAAMEAAHIKLCPPQN